MGMKFNPDYNKEDLRCSFCGTDKSVKYKVDIEVDGKSKEVSCCNRCVFQHAHDVDRKE